MIGHEKRIEDRIDKLFIWCDELETKIRSIEIENCNELEEIYTELRCFHDRIKKLEDKS